MATHYCRTRAADGDEIAGVELVDGVIIATDPEGVIVFEPADHPHPSPHRLRRRHLVAAIAERVGLTVEDAQLLMDAIENSFESAAVYDACYAVLPRAGSIDQRPGGVDAVTTVEPQYLPIVRFSAHIAERSGQSVDDVEIALAVVTRMIDDAPTTAAVYVPGWGYHGDDDALARVLQEDRQDAISYYRDLSTNVWLLQCNPAKFDVFAAIGESGELPTSWSIGRYRDDVRPGDRVVFWLSGGDAGVYALGEVTGEPVLGEVESDYLGDDGDVHQWEWFVPIVLDVDLFDEPIARAELKLDERFGNEPIIRAPFAANPHPVSAAAFEAIVERI